MRISNRNQMMSYLKHMNTNLGLYTDSNNKMASQRAFNKSYENVADATRALRIRKLLREDEFHLTNIRDTQGVLNSAEDNLKALNKVLDTTIDRTLQAMNGTYEEGDRKKIATEIENLQREALAMMNGSYAGKHLFAAAGGATNGEPFKMEKVQVPVMEWGSKWQTDADGLPIYEADGVTPKYVQKLDDAGDPVFDDAGDPVYVNEWQVKTEVKVVGGVNTRMPVMEEIEMLTYNGQIVDELRQNPTTGKIERKAVEAAPPYKNPSKGPYQIDAAGEIIWEEIPYNKTNYIDIGLGFRLTSANNLLDTETAIPITFSGAELMGVGKDANGVSNNVYTLLGQISDSMRTNDLGAIDQQFERITAVRDTLMIGITTIGSRSNFVNDMAGILENDQLILQTTQNEIEAVDLPEEAIHNKSYEMAWMVTLQMGSKVLPTSLFDFMR